MKKVFNLYLLYLLTTFDYTGIWLRTHPVDNNDWYNTLSSTLNIESAVQNVRKAVNEVIGGNDVCLTLKKNSNGGPSFQLESVQCDEKRSVICRRNSSSSNLVPKPSRFPCMAEVADEEKEVERKKRATGSKTKSSFDQISMQGKKI